jgi:hypothetical protein
MLINELFIKSKTKSQIYKTEQQEIECKMCQSTSGMKERSEFHCVPWQSETDWKCREIRKISHIYTIVWCIAWVTVTLKNCKTLIADVETIRIHIQAVCQESRECKKLI